MDMNERHDLDSALDELESHLAEPEPIEKAAVPAPVLYKTVTRKTVVRDKTTGRMAEVIEESQQVPVDPAMESAQKSARRMTRQQLLEKAAIMELVTRSEADQSLSPADLQMLQRKADALGQ